MGSLIKMTFVLLSLSCVVMLGCEEQGPFERAGEKIDESVEKTGESLEEAGEEVQDALN